MGTYKPELDDFILGDCFGLVEDLVRDILRSGATVRHVVFDTKVIVWSTGVVRGSQEDTTVGLVLPDDIRRGGGRENSVSADDKLGHIVRGGDLDDDLDGLRREITTITTNHERESLWLDRIENGLHKVLRVVLTGVMCVRVRHEETPSVRETKYYLLLEHLDTDQYGSLAIGQERKGLTKKLPFPETRGTWLLAIVRFGGNGFLPGGHGGR